MSAADAAATFTDVYTRATQDRPGAEAITADDMRWVVREHDPDKPKDFYVVHEDDDGRPDAAAIYRVKHRWRYDLPSVEARARQVWATTPQAWSAYIGGTCSTSTWSRASARARGPPTTRSAGSCGRAAPPARR